MKLIIIIAGILLLYLFGRIWFGQGSHSDIYQLQQQITKQQNKNKDQELINQQLQVEVDQLKAKDGAIEAYARSELGMIKKGETFYQVVLRPPVEPNDAQGEQSVQAMPQEVPQRTIQVPASQPPENVQQNGVERSYMPTYIPRKEASHD